MVAQDGADYATAKAKAARQVLGVDRIPANQMPDNVQVEDEVRKYQELFQGPEQRARLLQLRRAPLGVMEALAEFQPYLTGAVLSGSAGAHDDIELQLFADSPKDVANLSAQPRCHDRYCRKRRISRAPVSIRSKRSAFYG